MPRRKSRNLRSRTRRSTLLRGGLRTDTERAEGFKCKGHEDPVTQDRFSELPSNDEEVDVRYAIRLNDQLPGKTPIFRCYDVRVIKNIVETKNDYGLYQRNPVHALTRAPITIDQLKKIDKKIQKLKGKFDASGKPLLTDKEAMPIPRIFYDSSINQQIVDDRATDIQFDVHYTIMTLPINWQTLTLRFLVLQIQTEMLHGNMVVVNLVFLDDLPGLLLLTELHDPMYSEITIHTSVRQLFGILKESINTTIMVHLRHSGSSIEERIVDESLIHWIIPRAIFIRD